MTSRYNGSFHVIAAGIDDGIRFRLKEAALVDPRFILEESFSAADLSGWPEPVLVLATFRNFDGSQLDRLRAHGIPVLVSGPGEMILPAFEEGAADFLREPWGVEELLARCGRIVSRFPVPVADGLLTITSGGVSGPGGSVELSAAEGRLLRLLCSVPGQLVSRMDIALRIGLETGSRALDVHVCHLRKKLAKAVPAWSQKERSPIICERAKGYRFIPSRP
jgi:DNA-binding response OmpR family regulator